MSSPRFDLTSFGETMVRLSVPVGVRLEQAKVFDVHPGGTESNVCAALAGLGRRCGWLSRLPDGPLGRLVIRGLREAGVDTGAVVMAPGTRVGTYFVEFAAPPRSSEVIYDRRDSAVTELTSAEVDWDYLLDSHILHLTGVTPALSASCADLVSEAMHRARERGVVVSFDVNYRNKLWSPEEAGSRLGALLPLVDILVCGQGDAATIFGLGGEPAEVLEGLAGLTEARHIVLTRSDQGAASVVAGALVEVAAVPVELVDRLGAGDGFTSGLLDGFLDGDVVAGMRRGVALAALVLGQRGDMVAATRPELEQVMSGAGGDISR